MLNKWIASQNAALRGDENCIELRDRSHLCYKSIINYDLDIANFLVISPQIRFIKVFDLTNKFGQSPVTSLNRGSTVIKWIGSYVNIAEVVDIICCSLSVTRFTMVFGKFFAFLALKNKSYCICKCLEL